MSLANCHPRFSSRNSLIGITEEAVAKGGNCVNVGTTRALSEDSKPTDCQMLWRTRHALSLQNENSWSFATASCGKLLFVQQPGVARKPALASPSIVEIIQTLQAASRLRDAACRLWAVELRENRFLVFEYLQLIGARSLCDSKRLNAKAAQCLLL